MRGVTRWRRAGRRPDGPTGTAYPRRFRRRRDAALALLAAVAALAAIILAVGLARGPAARQGSGLPYDCGWRYAGARTAAETAMVDALPASGEPGPETPHTLRCGFYRRQAERRAERAGAAAESGADRTPVRP